MVGMGSVVTRSVSDFHLVLGNPARSVGAVCRCGHPIARWQAGETPRDADVACQKCESLYRIDAGQVSEIVSQPIAVNA
jgi:hypothetical protein